MVRSFIASVLPITILAGLLSGFLIYRWRQNEKHFSQLLVALIAAAMIIPIGSIAHAWQALEVSAWLTNQSIDSTFIADHYVDPDSITLEFPETKRNLIYIFLESTETTYTDVADGGARQANTIPALTAIAQQNEDFSGSSLMINGGYTLEGATWTMGGMFAQTTGLPLVIPVTEYSEQINGAGVNDLDTQTSVYPGIQTLGDILESQGYQNALLVGSDATFGGRRVFFSQHGNYQMWDYLYAKEVGLIPNNYHVWWGLEDSKLFEIGKSKLLELEASNQPFNLTMLTVDTHFEDGWLDPACAKPFGRDQMANVFYCSDGEVNAFIDWIKQQDFYSNTTIVLSGDHLSMDANFNNGIDPNYPRRTYTAVINAPITPKDPSLHREFSTMDMFPTTIAALGATIPGDHLGLGTDLFSDSDTWLERYGLNYVKTELSRYSTFMNEIAEFDQDNFAMMVRRGDFAEIEPRGNGYFRITVDQSIAEYTDHNSFAAIIWPAGTSENLWFSDDIDNALVIPLVPTFAGGYTGTFRAENVANGISEFLVQLVFLDDYDELQFFHFTYVEVDPDWNIIRNVPALPGNKGSYNQLRDRIFGLRNFSG